MASKRKLKKDVDQVIYEIVAECYSFMDIYPKSDHEKAYDLADKALDLQDETITKINQLDKNFSTKETKQHFSELRKDFIQRAEELFKVVDALFEEKEKQEA